MISRRYQRDGFTIMEMFAVVVIICVLVGILLPAIQNLREAARRTSCSNNFMQIGLAVHGYHVAFDQLPTHLAGTDGSTVQGQDNDRRLSFLVAILPFIDQGAQWETIDGPLVVSEIDHPWLFEDSTYVPPSYYDMTDAERAAYKFQEKKWNAGGPEPFDGTYPAWAFEPPPFRCPSDPGYGAPGLGRTNYAACLGDSVLASDSGPYKEINGLFVFDAELAAKTKAAMRGMFVPRVVVRLSDVTDGQANTIMLGEITTDLGDNCIETRPAPGPGEKILRDNPRWGRESEFFNPDRPKYWEKTTAMANSKIFNTPEWGRGLRWADGMPLYTGFNTILTPNREIVLRDDRDDCWGILPPSSHHTAGVNVCFADGSIRYISDQIEAGDASQPTVYVGSANVPGSQSPYGLWGALGTRAGSELKW